MSGYHLTGEFDIPDFDIRYRCTATYVDTEAGPKPVDMTLLHVVQSRYELPAEHGYDPEPVILDVRHTWQQIELEKKLLEEFGDVVREACREHACTTAGEKS